MASATMTSVSDWLGQKAPGQGLLLRDIHLDSRKVGNGDAFIAVAGQREHGREYIGDAVANGAAAIVVDQAEVLASDTPVPVITVADLEARLGELARQFYGEATASLQVLGVTGTNGKTSVTHILAHLLDGLGHRCAVVGTLGCGFVDKLLDTGMTTPDVVSVHRILAGLARDGADFVAMEVSSHGLDQGRVDGVDFRAAAFTNLSRDHLDYHGNMAAYAASKRALFERDLALSVFNLDDATGSGFYRDESLPGRRISYAIRASDADVYCREVAYLHDGCRVELVTPWGEASLQSPLLGPFNLSNLLAAVALLAGLGFDLQRLAPLVAALRGAPGRMEVVHGGEPRVLVDYAHTPDALAQALAAIRPHVEGRLWLVFGCGGDRDRGKRPLMARAAVQGADEIVITSDNPRQEDPLGIIKDIEAGMEAGTCYHSEVDRQLAIEYALAAAGPGDLVLVAGKGHEDYQDIGGQRRAFSDRACVEAYFRQSGRVGQ